MFLGAFAVETETFLRRASNISDQGIDAFEEEFSEMEKKLREVERILNSTNVTPADLQQLRDRIDELRSNLTQSNDALSDLDASLTDSEGRIETASNQLEIVKQRVEEVKMKAQDLRDNVTNILSLDPKGAFSLTLDAQNKSRRAEAEVAFAGRVVDESAMTRAEVEQLLSDRRNAFDEVYGDNRQRMDDLQDDLEQMKDDIQNLNRMVRAELRVRLLMTSQ